MALSREQTYLVAKYFLVTFTALTIIATFVGYGVVLNEINRLEEQNPDERNYWRSWRAFVICYLILEDITALVGLFGAVKENHRLVLSYAVVMTVLWTFNFFNYVIIDTNVFNYLMTLAVIVTAFYFAKRIRQRQVVVPSVAAHQMYLQPQPAVIQVSPTYIPSPSYMQNIQYSPEEQQSTPPPPYRTGNEPKLEFK